MLTNITYPILKEAEVLEDFDIVCTMSSTGLPVATLLCSALRKELLAVDDQEFLFLPKDKVGPAEKVLLLDSGIQTGSHLKEVINKIQSQRGIVVGALCICFNDLLPKEKSYLPIVDEMIEDGKVIYLYKISDLYNLWRQRRFKV